MNPGMLAGRRTLASVAARKGTHSDTRRTTCVRDCPYCKRDTLHTVYTSGMTTSWRCRRCARFDRLRLAR